MDLAPEKKIRLIVVAEREQGVTPLSMFLGGISLVLDGRDDYARTSSTEWEGDLANEWRHRVAVTVAIVLWLLTWLGGWWVGRTLSSGSFVMTLVGAVFGWCVGLGVATLVLYLDERL